jgi:hypothetical protein
MRYQHIQMIEGFGQLLGIFVDAGPIGQIEAQGSCNMACLPQVRIT